MSRLSWSDRRHRHGPQTTRWSAAITDPPSSPRYSMPDWHNCFSRNAAFLSFAGCETHHRPPDRQRCRRPLEGPPGPAVDRGESSPLICTSCRTPAFPYFEAVPVLWPIPFGVLPMSTSYSCPRLTHCARPFFAERPSIRVHLCASGTAPGPFKTLQQDNAPQGKILVSIFLLLSTDSIRCQTPNHFASSPAAPGSLCLEGARIISLHLMSSRLVLSLRVHIVCVAL